jgi:hypothetical protein
MTSKPMSPSRLRELVAAYGSNLERFPESERVAAEVLLQSSEHARLLVSSERALDALLDSAAVPPVSEALEQRLLAIPAGTRKARPLPVARRALVAPAVGWAIAAAVGLWIGAESASEEPVAEATAMVAEEAAIGELSEGLLEELEELP